MENHFSAHQVSHGLVQGPLDYSVILNWTYGSTRNVSAVSFLEPTVDFPRPTLSSLGFVSATLIAFLLSSHTALFKIKNGVMYQNVLQGLFAVILFLLIFPIFAMFAVYRCLIYCLLKIRSSNFISLMDGPDAVWNLQDSSQPIIMVLAEIEADGPEILLKAIRDAILKAIIMNPKLSWTRAHSQMGFSYWEMCNDLLSLKEHVHWMTTSEQNLENHITSSELQELISDIAHQGLPGDNSCWEILVSQRKLFTENEVSSAIYPVLFRVHHSLGDGISLLQLLLNSLSTSSNIELQKYSCDLYMSMKKTREEFCVNDFHRSHNLKSYQHTDVNCENAEHTTNKHRKEICMSQNLKNFKERAKSIDLTNYHRGVTEVFVSEGKIHLRSKRIVPHLSSNSFQSFLSHIFNFFGTIGNNIQMMKTMIYSLNRIKTTCETSLFDANELSGEKIIAWYSDSSQGHIFSSIKRIKSQVKGVRFIDVFLTALSGSVEKYLSERNASIPNCISVVIPVFMKETTESVNALEYDKSINEKSYYYNNRERKLQNTFSVGVVNLPIKSNGKNPLAQLEKVAVHTELMYKSGQFAVYSFILKWVTNLLPEPLLNNLLHNIGHNTMVISNLVGPANMLYIAGYQLKNMYFWVPHRGNTGFSVSILSYCNRLQLGIMVDKTIIRTAADVQCLLNEAVSRVTTLMN